MTGTNKQEESGPRQRVLLKVIERDGEAPTIDASEAARIWLAAPENDYGRIVRLLLLTACRRDEIGSLQWSEIDMEARTITLPPERTKNGRAFLVPLSDAAIAILKDIEPRGDRPYVFGGGKAGYSGWSKSKKILDAASGVKDWTLHDLRRTVRTGLGAMGIDPHIAEAVLNHLPPVLTQTYDVNTYAPQKRAALAAWAARLSVAVAQAAGANVTELQSRKGA